MPPLRLDLDDRGPDDDVEVTFEGSAGEYELKVRCVGREPVAVPDA